MFFNISFFQQFLWIKYFIFSLGDRMKVKIFDEESETDLQNSINNFLSDMEGELIDIKFQVSASVYSEEQIYCFSAMIVYR